MGTKKQDRRGKHKELKEWETEEIKRGTLR